MKPVTKDQFYAAMNPLDVHPSIQPGRWPYTSLWRLRQNPDGQPLGKSVSRADGSTEYFLAEG